jgi:hypothetical protein
MIFVLFGIGSSILLLGVAIAIVLCIAAWLALRKIWSGAKGYPHKIALEPSRTPLKVQKIPANAPGDAADQEMVSTSAPRPNEIDCLKDSADLNESLAMLAGKYSLDEITLATSDGLLLASSRKTSSADAVARYTGMYAENVQPWPPGVMLFGLEHKGSFLVGIVKKTGLLVQEPDQDMVRETKDILNWWI